MGWRDFQNPFLVEKAEKEEFTISRAEQIPQIPPRVDSEFRNSTSLGPLSEPEQAYYHDLLEIMQSPKFGLNRETAEKEAGEIIIQYRLRKKQRNSKTANREG